jgi:hypothetical protein
MTRHFATRSSSRVVYRHHRNQVSTRLGLALVALGIVWMVLVVHLASTYLVPTSQLLLSS